MSDRIGNRCGETNLAFASGLQTLDGGCIIVKEDVEHHQVVLITVVKALQHLHIAQGLLDVGVAEVEIHQLAFVVRQLDGFAIGIIGLEIGAGVPM